MFTTPAFQSFEIAFRQVECRIFMLKCIHGVINQFRHKSLPSGTPPACAPKAPTSSSARLPQPRQTHGAPGPFGSASQVGPLTSASLLSRASSQSSLNFVFCASATSLPAASPVESPASVSVSTALEVLLG